MKTSKDRNNMIFSRKIIPFIFVTLFVIFVFTVAVLAIVLPKPIISVSENRVLEPKPDFSLSSLFSGEYTADFERYYSDTFPARDKLAEIAAGIESLRGNRKDGDVVIYDGTTDTSGKEGTDKYSAKKKALYDAYLAAFTPLEPLQKSSKLSPVSPDITKKDDGPDDPDGPDGPDGPDSPDGPDGPGGQTVDDPEEDGSFVSGVFVIGDTAFETFGRNDTAGSSYAEKINAWRAVIPANIKVYNLIVPKHNAFGLSSKYANTAKLTGDQKNGIDHIFSELADNIIAVRVYDALYAHKNEYIYFRTDHHWTGLGAYYAYREFAKAAGFEPLELSSYEKYTFDGYLGTLYSKTQDTRLKNNPDTVEAYVAPGNYTMTYYTSSGVKCTRKYVIRKKPTSTKNSYGVFIDGDNPLTIIENERSEKNGRVLLMVKESYGNCFAPYTVSHFDRVYVIDQRYYNKLVEAGTFPVLSKFITENGVTDVLFINNMQAALGSLQNYLTRLLDGKN